MAHTPGIAASSDANNKISAQLQDISSEKSWGDRYKQHTFSSGTYIGINYFINASLSTAITYLVERKYDPKIQEKTRKWGESLANTLGGSSATWSNRLFGVSRGFLITTGGTALVPVIKGLEDHRQSIQFRIGHALDTIQEILGMGNSASKRNIAEYARIKQMLKSGDTSSFNANDLNRLQKQHHLHVNEPGNVHFNEQKLPWLKVIAARITAYMVALPVNSYILHGSKNVPNKWFNYQHYEDLASPKIDKGILGWLPGVKGMVPDERLKVGRIFFNEMLSTVSSSVTHKFVQGKMHKQAQFDGEDANPMPAQAARKQKIADGVKDFRTRESLKPSEPGVALS